MKALNIVINEVNFNIQVVEHEGTKWIPITPVCELLGVVAFKQVKRVEADPRFTTNQLVGHDAIGREQQMTFIPILQLEAFLFTINVRLSQKPEVKERLLAFQKSVVTLIHQAFNGESMDTTVVKMLLEQISILKEELRQRGEMIDYLMRKDVLNEQYVDKKLASAGASMMSSYGHKKRKLTIVS